MNLFEQLQVMLTAAKTVQKPDARFFTVTNGVVGAYYNKDLRAIAAFYGARLHASSRRRYMSNYTRANGIRVEVPIIRAIPLEHTCPPECYRIHLTTPPPDASVPSAPSTPVSEELLKRLYRGDEI